MWEELRWRFGNGTLLWRRDFWDYDPQGALWCSRAQCAHRTPEDNNNDDYGLFKRAGRALHGASH